MSKVFLSVVVPTYNEEERIENCLKKIKGYFSKQNYSYEVIFVDDASIDKTVKIIKDAIGHWPVAKIIENQENHGKGYVVRQGMLAASGKYILFTDADLSTPIEDVEKLLLEIDKFPIIIGSRYLAKKSIKIAQPLTRRIISRFGNFLIRAVLGLNFADTQCGFKLFSSKVAKDVFSRATINRWGFDMEILAIAQQLGYKIKEKSVNWYNDPHSKLRAGKAALETFKELFKIKINLISGTYDPAKTTWLGKILRSKTVGQFVKFAVVGVGGTAVDWVFYFAFTRWFAIFYLLAKALSFLIAAINNYIWNRIWTFESHQKKVALEFSKFFVVSLVGLGFNTLIMYLVVDKLRFNDFWGLVLATAAVMLWNFFANKFWTFKNKEK